MPSSVFIGDDATENIDIESKTVYFDNDNNDNNDDDNNDDNNDDVDNNNEDGGDVDLHGLQYKG
jgi:hypothetical protein